MINYLELTFQIDSETEPQRAQVRASLPVADLIAEIVREFEIGSAAGYDLYREHAATPLAQNQSLEAQQVYDGQTLRFMRSVLAHRRALPGKRRAALQLVGSNKVYPLRWQPAIIGRPDADPIHSSLLAVNLDWHPNNRRISRRHAQIIEDAGRYFIELLAVNNSVFLNKQQLEADQKYVLKHGDAIFLRNSKVELRFLLKG